MKMPVPNGEEQILLPETENASEVSKSPSLDLNPDSVDGSPPVSTVYTDVGVVPEHQKNELEHLISNLEGEIEELRLKQKKLDKKRREELSKILDIKGSIRVFCRIRPNLVTEKRKFSEPVSAGPEKIRVKFGGTRKDFEFDKVFTQEASQESVFVEVEPILRSAMDGHNVCVFAYGQTGTGKTFTMDGTNEEPGIIPRALEELFRQASLDNSSSFTFTMSMLEVYMGNLRDLLSPRQSGRPHEQYMTKCNLNIQTDPKGLIEIEGLSEVQISDYAKAKWWYNKGKRFRSTSWTNVNEASSRSHCLTRISIFRRGDALEAKSEVSKLWMIDLGGSERLLKTGAKGLTLDEGRAINLSLSALADVVAALKRKRCHVPYRNSKLTQILKDSLGYGSKVLMLVHISPSEEDVCETVCSLNFAKRARAIESNKEVPVEVKKQKEKKIMELEEDIKEAEKQSQNLREQIQQIELKLNESKKLLFTTYSLVESDDIATSISPKDDVKEVIETPKASKKSIKRNFTNSMPRFMTSTVASRQRQSAAERDIGTVRLKSFRSIASKSSINFSYSQSLSYSDFRIKAILRSSNGKSRYAEADSVPIPKTVLTEKPKCNNDLEPKVTTPRSKMVTSSDQNFRVSLGRHRRRMSDLI
ncbi:kinesin-like protein KIN-14U [Glycine soja]|uniref:Kinesin-like protein KIN-14U n=1 Tax=Glycine soja TaxID=3848 RepID=A0A445IN73_GLYSO|nr:kinesin-like protein KIN-14U [Glycine soja]XP_028185809.1 kinesin-like protein KIN-14U [Glycine soja]XP_028185810.1 kinesin-like protein KIN-14U [Glycine soja]XP_028185811.1 kinesin-like protein KIN-14U [Glycine soja]RZB87492.1 Kinesin-like protein KIN-14U [Glycine soja]